MAGKAAGSAGVCATDTCLDSITPWNLSFLPIKMKKKKKKEKEKEGKKKRGTVSHPAVASAIVSVTASRTESIIPSSTLISTATPSFFLLFLSPSPVSHPLLLSFCLFFAAVATLPGQQLLEICPPSVETHSPTAFRIDRPRCVAARSLASFCPLSPCGLFRPPSTILPFYFPRFQLASNSCLCGCLFARLRPTYSRTGPLGLSRTENLFHHRRRKGFAPSEKDLSINSMSDDRDFT